MKIAIRPDLNRQTHHKGDRHGCPGYVSCSFRNPTQSVSGLLPSLAGPEAATPEPQDLAVQVLAGAQPVSDLAREHEVSRKFLYQQAHTAQDALTHAFDPDRRPKMSSSTCL